MTAPTDLHRALATIRDEEHARYASGARLSEVILTAMQRAIAQALAEKMPLAEHCPDCGTVIIQACPNCAGMKLAVEPPTPGVTMTGNYSAVADELVRRIAALIPSHPEILRLDSPWGLFKVEGFKCDDLQPTMYQAAWALSVAKTQFPMPLAEDPDPGTADYSSRNG